MAFIQSLFAKRETAIGRRIGSSFWNKGGPLTAIWESLRTGGEGAERRIERVKHKAATGVVYQSMQSNHMAAIWQ